MPGLIKEHRTFSREARDERGRREERRGQPLMFRLVLIQCAFLEEKKVKEKNRKKWPKWPTKTCDLEITSEISHLPACRRLLFLLLHAEKGRLRNAVANRVPASRSVPEILGTCCDRLTHSAHCLT